MLQELRQNGFPNIGWQRIVGLAFLLLCCAAAYLVGATTGNQTNVVSGLTVDVSRLDLGEVWENKDFRWTLPITNSSHTAIDILDVYTSCGCAQIQPRAFTLAPGETKELDLSLDLSLRPDAGAVREFSLQVVPQVQNAPPSDQGWVIRGRLKRAFSFVPAEVDFGEVLIGDESATTRAIRVTPNLQVGHLAVTCQPPLAITSIKQSPNRANAFDIMLTLPKDIRPGPFQFVLAVQAVPPEGQMSAFGYIPVTGTAVEEIQILPPSLLLAVRPLDECIEETIVLTSRTGKEFSVKGLHSQSPDTQVRPIGTIFRSSRQAFRITQRIARPGRHSTQVVFDIALSGESTNRRVTLPIIYYGLACDHK
ncbi:MAG TPA: DUF1573 domain-containing protein [Candidatus Obscuribacterales bacterium]